MSMRPAVLGGIAPANVERALRCTMRIKSDAGNGCIELNQIFKNEIIINIRQRHWYFVMKAYARQKVESQSSSRIKSVPFLLVDMRRTFSCADQVVIIGAREATHVV